MDGAEMRQRMLEIRARRKPTEKICHAMDAPVLHGRREMMGAGHNVGNDFSIGGILDRGFEDPDDSGRSIAEAAAEAKDFTDDGRNALDSARPKPIGQDGDDSGVWNIFLRAHETAADGMRPHPGQIEYRNDD